MGGGGCCIATTGRFKVCDCELAGGAGTDTTGGGGGNLGWTGLLVAALLGGGGGGTATPPGLPNEGPIFSFSASGLEKKL